MAGDGDAFATLFLRHRDRLWAVALRTCGDREDAADALQDGLTSAFRRAESFRGDAAVSTWLHRIVVNACLDRMRRGKVRLAEPLPDHLDGYAARNDGTFTTRQPPGADDPVDAVLSREHRATVLAALERLPPEQKAALVLVDMEGYPVQEAAAILGCAPGTVKSRCSRGRSRLVPALEHLVGSRTRPDADPSRNPATGSSVQADEPPVRQPARHSPPQAKTSDEHSGKEVGGSDA